MSRICFEQRVSYMYNIQFSGFGSAKRMQRSLNGINHGRPVQQVLQSKILKLFISFKTPSFKNDEYTSKCECFMSLQDLDWLLFIRLIISQKRPLTRIAILILTDSQTKLIKLCLMDLSLRLLPLILYQLVTPKHLNTELPFRLSIK